MKGYRRLAIGVGLLSPLSYILVLAALQGGAPLSIVAPMREMSMMAGALLAMLVLREDVGVWRLAGCGVLIAGGEIGGLMIGGTIGSLLGMFFAAPLASIARVMVRRYWLGLKHTAHPAIDGGQAPITLPTLTHKESYKEA